MKNAARLREFVRDMTRLVERHGADEPRVLEESELPRSLRARVAELGGRMQAQTSVSGSVLSFELPI